MYGCTTCQRLRLIKIVYGVSHKDGGLTTALRSPKSRVLLQSFIRGRSIRLENAYTAFSLSYNYTKLASS